MKQGFGWIGVDIGTHSIKLAQVRRVGQGAMQIVDAAVVQRELPWELTAADRGAPAPSAGEIRAALDLAAGCRGRMAACLPPRPPCEVRVLDRPSNNSASLSEQLAEELRQLSEDPSSYVVDYAPLAPSGKVMAALLPIRWSERVSADLSRSRLACETIDAIPLALARAVGLHCQAFRGPVAAVDWGASGTTLAVIQEGAPAYVRQLPDVQYGRLRQQASETLGLSSEEAQFLLKTVGLPAAPGKTRSAAESPSRAARARLLLETIGAGLERFAAELTKTFAYLRSHQASLLPTRLLLFGGGATIPNVDQQLRERLKIPCHVWRFSDRSPVSNQQLLGPAIALSTLAWKEQPTCT